MSTPSSRSTTSRLLSLVLGPAYLILLAQWLSHATQTPLAIAVALTTVGSVTVMAVLTVLGVKAYKYKHSAIRFTLSTAFLVAIPLCVYLAAVRWIFRDVPTQDWGPLHWFVIPALMTMLMIGTTAVLLWLAEAIVWLAVVLRRRLSTKRVPDGSPQMRNYGMDRSGD